MSMIKGKVQILETDALAQERSDRFAADTGLDPRALATPERRFHICSRHTQAWRGNDKPDRERMPDGRWLV